MRFLVLAALTAASGMSLPFSAHAEPTWQTEKVVVLMRHGVRPQTNLKEIAPLTNKKWADFGVADGTLTPHAAIAAGRLGAWEGQWLAAKGVLAAPKCPAPGEVFAWSSRALQRTTDTGNAFLDAMFPGCGVRVGRSSGAGADALFTATETDVGKLDLEAGKAAILEAMGGSFDQPKARLKALHAELQDILGGSRPELCHDQAEGKPCSLMNIPWEIVPTSDLRGLKIEGPLSLAATVSQVFLLQYAEGLFPGKLAWGRVPTVKDVLRLSEMRKIKYEYYERVPYLARRGASNMLAQLMLALADGTDTRTGLNRVGPPSAKYVLFVGSDTQIAQIGGMLDLHWKPTSYLEDETPPTGGLVFERLRDPANGARAVRISFVTPTLDQIRNASVLDAAHPPEVLPLVLTGCGNSNGHVSGGTCGLQAFADWVRSRMDVTATADPDYK